MGYGLDGLSLCLAQAEAKPKLNIFLRSIPQAIFLTFLRMLLAAAATAAAVVVERILYTQPAYWDRDAVKAVLGFVDASALSS